MHLHRIVDVDTGNVTEIPYTPEEEAQAQAAEAQATAEAEAEAQRLATRQALLARLGFTDADLLTLGITAGA